jgi:hypothetical protein
VATSPRTLDLLRHLASRPGHDEVKAGYRQLLIDEFGAELANLRFEQPVPEVRGRIDALIGRTVFEAKRNLDREWADVEKRMPDYLRAREEEEGERFVGIASDGLRWTMFERAGEALARVKDVALDPERPEAFLAWLDSVVQLKSSLPPDPLTIRIELGQDSPAFHRAAQDLAALWERVRDNPAVILKRQLWARLLKLVYGRDSESDALWFQHTFLVVVSKAIALAVAGLVDDEPRRVLSGASFEAAGIYGAVESDFFDWVVADAGGEALVRRLLGHVRRFRLAEVKSDVLKILYESLIDRDERHGLGEYYTPDWLAAKIVRHAVERPIEQKVLDPACGSGTFLFHAVRTFLAEAEEGGMPVKERASEATDYVAGMDIHPVAVIIARVTYLLALGPVISQRGGPLYIPVYLADAMQLSTNPELTGKELTIEIPDPPGHVEADNGMIGRQKRALRFPEILCKDIRLFDKLVARMREASEQGMARAEAEALFDLEIQRHYRRDLTPAEAHGVKDLGAAYVVFDQLRREGRDSVWTYVARNLSRPLALAFGNGWANVVLGNPPWVAFRHMSKELQARFKELSKGERLHVGGKFGTQSDLSALFTVRSAGFYLRPSGRIAFVLPLAALTRGQFERLRTGSFNSAKIAWDEAWTMDDGVQPLFPVPSCVVFGRKRATAKPIPEKVRAYSGTLPFRDAPEDIANVRLAVTRDAPKPAAGQYEGGSPYRKAFRQGATLVPRMLCLVERRSGGRFGSDPSAPYVASRRNPQEKRPWKDLPGIENRVEAEFLHPVLLGESIVPYRVFRPFEGVVPVTPDGKMLDARAAATRGFSGLSGWMRKAEAVWNAHRPSPISFVQQLEYYAKLSAQFPTSALRVVYAASGTIPAASMLRDGTSIIEHGVYWSTVSTVGEALYLAAILNSETARARTAALQARGQWGARHFDKVMFTLPIPRFDARNRLHRALAEAAAEAETIAAVVNLPEDIKFQRARKLVRDALADAGVAPRIDALVATLLGGA